MVTWPHRRPHRASPVRRRADPMRPRGFTLLEIMVAVAILALSLTALLSSQVGASKAAKRARGINVATLMARCKMNEMEQDIAVKGLPAVDAKGRDKCCEGGELPDFRCEWRITRVVLPEASAEDQGRDEESELPAPADKKRLGQDFGSVDSILQGGGSGDALAELALSYAMPVLKPVVEEQVRRAEVEVLWQEGTAERQLKVVQFLVGQQPVTARTESSGPGGSS